MDDQAIIEAGEATIDSLIQLATSDEGWKFVKDKDGVKIHSRHSDDSPIVLCRGLAEFAVSADTVLKCTEDLKARTTWDALFIEGNVLKDIDADHQVIQFKFKSPSMMVSNRDFVMARAIRRNDDGSILANHVSIPFPACPEIKGFVRGEIYASGYHIVPTGPSSCTCAYVVQVDPKGWIPSVVVNAVATKQPMVLGEMKKYLSK